MPTLDLVDQPWREPPVFSGTVEAGLPLMAYDGGQVCRSTVRAGHVAAEHRRPYDNCNDAVSLWSDAATDVCVMAVADGVGPADDAGRAARGAVRLATAAVRRRVADPQVSLGALLRTALGDVENTLQGMAQGLSTAFRATLVVAVARVDVQPGALVDVAVARVGDSSAWRVRSSGMEPLFPEGPPREGRVDPPTAALPGHFAGLQVVETRFGDGEVLALVTDGLVSDGPHDRARSFLGSVWAAPPTPLEFLSSLAYRRNDRDDDRAAAVLWFGHHEQG